MTKENFNLPPEGKQYGNEFLSNHKNILISNRISTLSPFIIFPVISFCFHDWWLLLGILFSNIGGMLSIANIWIVIALIITIAYSLIFGFVWNSYANIFFLCYTYGHITFSISRYFINKLEETKSKITKQVDRQMEELRSKGSTNA
jgi:hypothetical protein